MNFGDYQPQLPGSAEYSDISKHVGRVKRFPVFRSSSNPVREQTPPFRASGFARGEVMSCPSPSARDERSAANARFDA